MIGLNKEVLNKSFIRQRVGDMQQIAGIRKMQFCEGRAKGSTAFEVNTGGGLAYTVLADRGLDIAFASYKGAGFSYLSKTGIASPAFYIEDGVKGFLRVFHAGLLTTCGYTYMGAPSEVDGKAYGLHGRATGIPADELNYSSEWQGDEYVLSVEGKMRESVVFGENIVLNRKIVSTAGNNAIRITDKIINEGFAPSPVMVLYHINFGYPLLDEGAEVFIPAAETESADPSYRDDVYAQVEPPQEGYCERVFYHTLKSDQANNTMAGIFNKIGDNGFGVMIRFNRDELPMFTQWKQMGQQDYVMGLEPGTNRTQGVKTVSENEKICMLAPGEVKTHEIEIKICESYETWTAEKGELKTGE